MKNNSHNRSNRKCGFTIIELLTAVAITSIMLFLINTLYFQTTNAVSAGVATSDFIGKVRAATEEFERITNDVFVMRGPGKGGFLVITNQLVSGPTGPIVESLRTGRIQDNLRSDMICFIGSNPTSAAGPKFSPLTPYSEATFDNALTAPYFKVWLGHMVPTNANGTPGPGSMLAANPLGHEWTLGLQLLYLYEDSGNPLNDAALIPPAIYADSPLFNAAVQGAATAPATVNQLCHGLTDVTMYSFTNDGPGSVGAPGGDNDPATEAVAGTPDDRLLVDLPPADRPYAILSPSQSEAVYEDKALQLTYCPERLRVNPLPSIDFYSWQVAQGHATMLTLCSEVVIEFAADITPKDGNIDVDGSGNIIWYGLGNVPAGYAPAVNPVPAAHSVNADVAFVWRHDDTTDTLGGGGVAPSPDGLADNWPYLIRIRIRLNDRRGALEHREQRDTNSLTPPLSDFGKEIPQAGAKPGKWFERIIKVNRDVTP